MNKKTLKKINVTMIIIGAVCIIWSLFTSGNTTKKEPVVDVAITPENIDRSKIESVDNETSEREAAARREKINNLVLDVESGIAGHGEQRRQYLGEYYDEVQKIIEEKYNKSNINTNMNVLKSYAYGLSKNKGWSDDDYLNLLILWEKESGWNPNAVNKNSGAFGIPQALPSSKIDTHGDKKDPFVQISWGLDYIQKRYKNPSEALWFHKMNNYY